MDREVQEDGLGGIEIFDAEGFLAGAEAALEDFVVISGAPVGGGGRFGRGVFFGRAGFVGVARRRGVGSGNCGLLAGEWQARRAIPKSLDAGRFTGPSPHPQLLQQRPVQPNTQ